jgi:[ribosomal protein S5]-alanine N-acetyltransferase
LPRTGGAARIKAVNAPRLEGEKVLLRALHRSDAPELVRQLGDPAVRRGLRLDRAPTLEEELALVERLGASAEDLVFGICARDGGRLLGVVGLHQVDRDSCHAQLGIFIGDPAQWNRGYGTEATRLAVAHAFGAMRLNRVWLHVFADNPAAIRVYEKLGFRREGVLRQHQRRGAAWVDVVAMAVLRGEWSGVGAPAPCS